MKTATVIASIAISESYILEQLLNFAQWQTNQIFTGEGARGRGCEWGQEGYYFGPILDHV